MSCPKCHGELHNRLTPNYVECTSEVSIPTESWEPAGPQGQMVPLTRYATVVCGHRYYDGELPYGAPVCSTCSMFAIGRCATCGEYVCGVCSTRSGQLLCHGCDPRRAAAQRAAAERADAAARQAAEVARSAEEAAATFERGVVSNLDAHPVARLCQVMRLAGPSERSSISSEVWLRNRQVVRRYLPQGRFGSGDAEIAAWFASVCRAAATDIPLPRELSRSGRRQKKQTYAKGWIFPKGSTYCQARGAAKTVVVGAAVTVDGQRLYSTESYARAYQTDRPGPHTVRQHLSALCLAEMADLAGVAELPEAGIDDPGRDADLQ